MENNPPSGPRINLASLKKNKHRPRMSTASPMASDRIYNMDSLQVHVDPARLQLISPPPEETLRRISRSGPFTPSLVDANTTSNPKRKRSQQVVASSAPSQSPSAAEQPQLVEATPNPKPRKQLRQHARTQSIDSPTRPSPRTKAPDATTPVKVKHVLFQSPHVENPDADFIPPVPAPIASAGPSRRATLSARSRRSATPIPPYEPPKDVFTPPREVFVTPTISKSSKRKTTTTSRSGRATSAKGKGLRVNTKAAYNPVKMEMPDVDLSAPMPPPSPTDDPLLLSGPPEPASTPTRPKRAELAVGTQDDELPPSSPPPEDVAEVEMFDWQRHTEPEGSTDFSMIDLDPADADVAPLPLFDLNDLPAGSNGGWSDSDDDDEDPALEGEGEYTGRWRMMKVRTKADPPSSATRGRMEDWGRPISPFPRKVERLSLVGEDEQGEREEEHEEEMEEEEEVRRLSVEPEDRQEEEEEEEVRRMSVEPDGGRDTPTPDDHFDSVEQPLQDNDFKVGDEFEGGDVDHEHNDDEEDDEEREVREMSVEYEQEEETPAVSQAPLDLPSVQYTSPSPHVSSIAANISPPHSQHQPPNHFTFPTTAGPSHSETHVFFPTFDASVSHDRVQHGAESAEAHSSRYRSQSPTGIRSDAFVDEDTHMRYADVVDVNNDDDEDDTSSDGEEVGVVKITSADPRAAARAAAILKQHDYDCFTKIVMKRRHAEAKKRRDSHSSVDDLAKGSRRRGVSSAGVAKEEHDKKRRRSTLGMGVIGDQVFIPGSPTITLPELLKEAEAEVVSASPSIAKTPGLWARRSAEGTRDPFKTPLPERYRVQRMSSGLRTQVEEEDISPKEWTKEDWKQLDACFTDERLEVGRRLGLADADGMASVDLVHVEDVVERFVQMTGGEQAVANCGEKWTRDNLLQRVRALQNKQRSGNVAPPTTPATPQTIDTALGGTRRVPSMDVPDFTPLGRRAPPPRKQRPMLPLPVVQGAPFEHMPKERPTKLHASLLAPRYSHLLEEAIAVSQEVPHTGDNTFSSSSGDELLLDTSIETVSDASDVSPPLDEELSTPLVEVQTPTIGKRVKGFLFSYLPTLSKTRSSASNKAQIPCRPGLPLPPLDVLEKPRGPVVTPIRPPVPKAKHPKELVHLNHAPLPSKVSMIPRAVKPRRLVELHPPPAISEPVPIPRPRRSSGGSVKDLVRSFEELDGHSAGEKEVRKMGLNRVRSLGELKRGREDNSRPTWKL